MSEAFSEAFAFLRTLFSSDGFMPRLQCGRWDVGLFRVTVAADLLIWGAYLAIPCVLGFFALKKRAELPFRNLFWLFGLFIAACGTTHLMDVLMFWHPLYRLAAAVKFITACASWGTVCALITVTPRALAMQSPATLERIVRQRTAELGRANAELARVNLDLERANAVKERFLQTLSHELTTPLVAVEGWQGLLAQQNLSEEIMRQGLESMERNLRQLQSQVGHILEASHSHSGRITLQLETLDVWEVVQEAGAATLPAIRAAGLRLTTRGPDETQSSRGRGDRSRLVEVFGKLLDNAIKFTPRGGRICIGFESDATHLRLRVSDSGRGIEASQLEAIFEPFYGRSNVLEPGAGLGLGLSMARHLCELHGGSLSAHSDGEGRGATFQVELPLHREA